MKYKSSQQRLMELPAWFSVRQASIYLRMDPKKLSVYLARWRSQGMVSPLGGRTGIYFNKVREPETSAKTRAAAISHIYPEAVVMGDTVLHAHGWTTQIPNRLDIAVLNKNTSVKMDGVELHQRPKRWFQRMQGQMVPSAEGDVGIGLRELTPEAALVDQVARGVALDWDDLDIEDASRPLLFELGREFSVTKKLCVEGLMMAGDGMAGRKGPGASL